MPAARVLLVLALSAATGAMAQQVPAPAASATSMDMPGMSMGNPAAAPVSASTAAPGAVPVKPSAAAATPGHDMHDMTGMDHGSSGNIPAPPAQPKSSVVPMAQMGPMQGGSAPPGARSGDYSDGVDDGAMTGMDMQDNAVNTMLLVDQFESVHGGGADGQSWEAEGWTGNDNDKLWLRSEGERQAGTGYQGGLEALWNHTIAAYWSTQLGLRQDFGQGPARQWAAFGVQGLSPYWFELEATGYVGDAGRTAARFRAEYEVLLTQRLVLQPELEVNVYGQADASRRERSGLSDAQLGLRLRYEISRQFAPYVGLVWSHRFARDDSALPGSSPAGSSLERQWTVGVRFWF